MNHSEIDKLIADSWKSKYSNSEVSIKLATQTLEKAIKINYTKAITYSKLILAFGCFLKSENEKAFNLLEETFDFFENNKSEWGYVVALYLKGNLYEGFGDFDKALKFSNKALKLSTNIGYIEGKADTLSVLGNIYIQIKDYSSALKSFENCLEIREQLSDTQGIASILNRLGRVCTLKKDFQKGLNYYNKSIEIRKEQNLNETLAWSYLGKASLYEASKDFTKANIFYSIGLETLGQKGDNRCKMQLMLGLGKVLLEQDNLESAEFKLFEALSISKEIKSKPLEYQAHLALSQLFEKKQNTTKALEHFKLYDELKEEVLNDDIKNKLHQQQISFAIEDSRKEAEIHRLKNVELKEALTEIKSSITYASYIQTASLPTNLHIKNILPESFIFFRPRDIVSGDFYFVEKSDFKVFFSAVDCTGHGVPGSLMSMLGHNFLLQAVHEKKLKHPNEILSFLDFKINEVFKQSSENAIIKDGMDIAFCVFDLETRILEYAGAYNPLYIVTQSSNEPEVRDTVTQSSGLLSNEPEVRDTVTQSSGLLTDEPEVRVTGEDASANFKRQTSTPLPLEGVGGRSTRILFELKANNLPIGSNKNDVADIYTNHEFKISQGDTIYLFSDGYADQFGGIKGKKFKYSQLKELFVSIYSKNMDEQLLIITETYDKWKGENFQVDDVIILGVRF
ncbi:MAG: hypothetical protein A2033_04075 [Bacteroidetes bacterium GWA2_31_9]|nr:MAG: hypothetical protein A2033_04075 [Bacteroidetes bacterium GWA2_31_9]